MFRSLATAASGMEAQQTKLDVTANNIANVSTNGFKKGRAEFADLMYQQTARRRRRDRARHDRRPRATEIGLGVRLASTAREHSQGELHSTGNPLDVAIQGKGFFPVTMPNGTTAVHAQRRAADDRRRQARDERRLRDRRRHHDSARRAVGHDRADGTVTATVASRRRRTTLGQIQLATFANPGGLEAQGGNLFRETSASGTAVLGNPGEGGAGSIARACSRSPTSTSSRRWSI